MSTLWFADRIAFVDLETTGSSPASARITEIGVVLLSRETLDTGDAQWQMQEWSSLVNPGLSIPPEIQFLTGISNAMVADAPRFASLAPALQALLGNAVFVAHHARFDYGFIKQAFSELAIDFTVKTLCTVRLSKLLDPDRSPHSLDALIHRHGLNSADRHRALGDARIIHQYLNKMYSRRGADVVNDAVRRLLKQPSLPAHLPTDALTSIPNVPGVYQFIGSNEQPLYIGKSIHLRERVASHFVNDHRSERGVRLASEIRRIDWQQTAGDFGAQLLERQLIRMREPSHNAALRRKSQQIVLLPQSRLVDVENECMSLAPSKPATRLGRLQVKRLSTLQGKRLGKRPAPLQWRRIDALPLAQLAGCFGPFSSRTSARRLLVAIAPQHGLCLAALGFERVVATSPCFNRQLGRCAGCCVGIESIDEMRVRLEQAIAPHRLPDWPFAGAVVLSEDSANGDRTDHHVLDQWTYLGTVAEPALALDLIATVERQFDSDTYRLIRKALNIEALVPPAQAQTRTQIPADEIASEKQAPSGQAQSGQASIERASASIIAAGKPSPAAPHRERFERTLPPHADWSWRLRPPQVVA